MISVQNCLDRDWKNKKEITNKEIATCIVEHGCEKEIPPSRQKGVEKEIERLKNIKTLEAERKCIENVLSCEPVQSGENEEQSSPEHYYDPDLFDRAEEAWIAMEWHKRLADENIENVWIHGQPLPYKSKNYAENLRRFKKKLEKLSEDYARLGGDPSDYFAAIHQIPAPDILPRRRHFKQYEDQILSELVACGTPKTRAKKIVKAIISRASGIPLE